MSERPRSSDSRTPPEELLESIADQFSVYIGKGVEFDSILEDVDPDLDITNLDDLLKIHFLLTGELLPSDVESRPLSDGGVQTRSDEASGTSVTTTPQRDIGVRDFLCLLPPRLRRLRTTTQRETELFDGEVRGRIDWQETIKERYRSGVVDRPVYACQLAEETVAIPENLVLWELLSAIQDCYTEATGIIEDESDIEWFSDWTGDSRLKDNLDQARSNIHLSELEAESERGSTSTVSDRTLRAVLESRSPLYNEAAELLQWYRRLQDHQINPDEAAALLRRRLFYPGSDEDWSEDDTPAFFELYWIFELLDAYDAADRNLITTKTDCIAAWSDGDARYELYHDWSGGSEFDFGESYFDRERTLDTDGESRFLDRLDTLLETQVRETREVFGHRRPQKQTRYPDIVFLRREGGSVTDIVLGEVKYTRSQQTAAKGLEELYRYMIFARRNGGDRPVYFTDPVEHFETPTVHGLLCVDAVEPQRSPAGNVSVLAVGDSVPLMI